MTMLGNMGWPETLQAGETHRPVALAAVPGQAEFYVADAARQTLARLGLDGSDRKASLPLPFTPSGLAVSGDGCWVVVTGGGAEGRVALVAAKGIKMEKVIPTGHSPEAPVFSPDGRRLYVCLRFADAVAVVDCEAGREIGRIPVSREPVAAALSGNWLWVVNLLPDGAMEPGAAATVEGINLAAERVASSIRLPNGSTNVRGIAISPDGKWAYITHTIGHYDWPTTQLDRGWMNVNAISVIDLANRRRLATVLLDEPLRGAANPWGIACSEDGKWIFVAQSGTHELSVIDRPALHARLGEGGGHGEDGRSLTFLQGLRWRVALPGRGPRAVAVVAGESLVAEYFSGDVCKVFETPGGRWKAQVVQSGRPRPLSDAVGLGEEAFFDATTCFQSWQSCATCHPDGRVDALNWDLLNDGSGNPKQTKSLLLCLETPPSMLTGIRSDAGTAVRAGFHHIQFKELPESTTRAVDSYLRSLVPLPGPKRAQEDQIARGKQVFENVGCAECHPAPLFTDLRSHNMGTGQGCDANRPFDTPTLVEIWRTRPYLSMGQAATLRTVIDTHGGAVNLPEPDKAALEAYLLSL